MTINAAELIALLQKHEPETLVFIYTDDGSLEITDYIETEKSAQEVPVLYLHVAGAAF